MAKTITTNKDIARTFHLKEAEVNEIWSKVDRSNTFPDVARGEDASTILKLVLQAQKQKLDEIVASKEEHGDELQQQLWHWSLSWKQWGLSEQIEENATVLETAEALSQYIARNHEMIESHVMDSLTWGPLGRLDKQALVEALRGDLIKDIELNARAE